ncbi:MAG: hypothetical protein ACYC8T_26710 [Myxococcaceae bacterium]
MNITFGNCAAWAPCGGNPVGTWWYTNVCLKDPYAQAKQVCAAVTQTNVTGTATGSLVFTSTHVTRKVVITDQGTLQIPASCVSPLTCAQIQTGIRNFFSGATCTANGGGCDCTVARTTTINDVSAYTASGNQLTVGSGTYDYCVAGGTFQYSHTDPNAVEHGNLSLTKQ